MMVDSNCFNFCMISYCILKLSVLTWAEYGNMNDISCMVDRYGFRIIRS